MNTGKTRDQDLLVKYISDMTRNMEEVVHNPKNDDKKIIYRTVP